MALFITAAKGTEKALKEELLEFGLRGVRADRGGVRVPGGREQAITICLRSRIAVRVLFEVGRFECPGEDALYEGVSAIEWERFLHPGLTLAVSAVSKHPRLTHTGYIAQRTKDAIVDRQRDRARERSSVDRKDADLDVFVHVDKGQAAIFIDASGRSLHQRGWRNRGLKAPLKETLAAAMLRMCGWDRKSALHDPMCGSGTLPIEADLYARGVSPQMEGRRFGFERWADFDETAAARLAEIKERVKRDALAQGPSCTGSDNDAGALEAAIENAKRARSSARFFGARIGELTGIDRSAHLIANPPYGERLQATPEDWRALERAFDRMQGHRITLLLPDDAPRDLMGRKSVSALPLYNGNLACWLVTWAPR
jgi:23S rRNA G2445 N2-methylase RlmL